METVICKNCESEFERRKSGTQKFCNQECYTHYRHGQPCNHVLEGYKGYEYWRGAKKVAVHQLLAYSKGHDPWKIFGNSKYQIHHKNGCKIDNRPDNVELVSTSENGRDGASRRKEYVNHTDILRLVEEIVRKTDLSIVEACGIVEDHL